MDGGTAVPCPAKPSPKGLSPRGRGNRPPHPGRLPPRGSIPAWTGEPVTRGNIILNRGVYPRVDGGTCTCWRSVGGAGGLSPRGRGNLNAWETSSLTTRSIPAWTGEPGIPDGEPPAGRVYPRVDGGTITAQADAGEGIGLSRVDGGTPPVAVQTTVRVGLSPRGRGNPHVWVPHVIL